MADISHAHRFEKFVPNLGNNQQLEKPFHLLIASGMSKDDYKAFLDRVMGMDFSSSAPERAGEAIALVFGDVVRMGTEPLSIQGKPITTLAEYFQVAVMGVMGGYHLTEVIETVKRFNSVEGTRALFLERLSGGFAFTVPPRAETH